MSGGLTDAEAASLWRAWKRGYVEGRFVERARLMEAVESSHALTTCREWPADGDRCDQPADFILWGKLYPPEALGPRCYAHASDHDPHMVGRPDQYAVVDLRPIRRAADQ